MNPTIRKPTPEEKSQAETWPIWQKEISQFPWQYDDKETCLIIEGAVTITNESGETFNFTAGDYVIFPQGMKCTWHITQDVKKHYNFG